MTRVTTCTAAARIPLCRRLPPFSSLALHPVTAILTLCFDSHAAAGNRRLAPNPGFAGRLAARAGPAK